MTTDAKNSALLSHPLGSLAGLAMHAQEWHTRDHGLGSTWAGLWHPMREAEILAVVFQHAQRIDDATIRRLVRRGMLPGVRDYALLWVLLPIEIDRRCCIDSKTTEMAES